MLGALAAVAPTAAEAAPGADSAMAPIRSLVRAHNKAFTEQDLNGVLACFTDRATLMGTGPGELWTGAGEIADAYRHFFLGFDAGRQKFEDLWHEGHISGDTAWLMAVSKVTMNKGSKKDVFGVNLSLVCRNSGGKWQFSTMHFSNLTGPARG